MRTTLTLDDDLGGILQQKALQQGNSLKAVVNDLLRAGLAATEGASRPRSRLTVVAKALHLKPGYDADKLGQLVDELEAEEFRRKHQE